MASANDRVQNMSNDANDQIRDLKRQVDALMRDRVTPYVNDAASRAQEYVGQARDYASQAGDMASEQAEALSGQIRERPFVSILIAAATGYLLGRISR